MNLSVRPFVLVVTRRGQPVETRECDSIAEAERRFEWLARRGLGDRGEVFAADFRDRPVRVLRVRQDH